MNLNSRTQEQINQPVSRQDAKGETIFNIQQGIFNFQGFWRGYLSAVAEPPCCPESGIRIAKTTTDGH